MEDGRESDFLRVEKKIFQEVPAGSRAREEGKREAKSDTTGLCPLLQYYFYLIAGVSPQ